MSAEQQAREMLQRMGIGNAEDFSSGDLVELANVIAERDRLREALVAEERAQRIAREHHIAPAVFPADMEVCGCPYCESRTKADKLRAEALKT